MKPQIVGAYEVGALLGAGTVGEVYRARHRDTGAPAVVKLLQKETAREPEVQRRFVREVAIAEKLSHPNIVQHYDCGLHEDQIYFAMELVDCGTLKEVMAERGRLPWHDATECAMQICAALQHAHERGIIHRDLKPANLFLSREGCVKVGDFGLARDLNKGRLTLEGQTVGTCRYMAPEQITGDADLTGAVDLYALGCILYQALAGRPPFDGNTIIEIFEAHLYSEPVPLTELVGDCPADLSDLVLRLLEKDPDERPAKAGEIYAALREINAGRPMNRALLAASRAANDSLASPEPNLTDRLYTRQSANEPTAGTPWLYALAAIGVLLLATVALVLLR